MTDSDLMRLEAIRREARTLFAQIESLENEAYSITREQDRCGHTTDLIYQSDCTVEELVRRLNETA